MLRAMATDVTPLVSRINVVYLYVRDVERSLAFYRDVLGLPLEHHPSDPHWAEARLPNGLRFALHGWSGGGDEPGGGAVRVNFEVDEIDAAVERLRGAGVEVGTIHREQYGAHAEFVDPDGYRFDVFQAPA